MTDFAFLESPKLISRKIWMMKNPEISTLWFEKSVVISRKKKKDARNCNFNLNFTKKYLQKSSQQLMTQMHNSNLICFHYSVTVDIFHVKLGLRTSVWMKHDWKMLLTIVMTKSLNFSSCWLSFLSHTTSKVKKCTLRMCVLSFIQLTRFFYICSNFKRACTLENLFSLKNEKFDKITSIQMLLFWTELCGNESRNLLY